MNSANIKKSVALLIALLCFALLTMPLCLASYADKNSPPDESVQPRVNQEEADAKKKAEEEKINRQRRAAEARRRAAEAARRKSAAESAADNKLADEIERMYISDDLTKHTIMTGRLLVEEGKFWSAIRVLDGFVKGNPNSVDAWYWLSRARHALGDYEKAQAAVNIALEIDPYYPALTKTPNGLQPMPKLSKRQKREPRPSMSLLPIKQPLPANLWIEPVTISFPRLIEPWDDKEGPLGYEDTYTEYDISDPAGEAYKRYSDESDEAEDSRDESFTLIGNEGRNAEGDAYLRYAPYPPLQPSGTEAWFQSESFNEISRWRIRVDRMGILKNPRVPVAWKGSHPYEVYFWTGTEWARVRKEKMGFDFVETYDDILFRVQAILADLLEEYGYEWFESDVPSLAASASLMRYKWIGDIDLTKAEQRAIKRAKLNEMIEPLEKMSELERGQ
ncbi:MAG: tetratricopeptide repeat protein [Synergistaceae bacterium]|jgi:tetratricopeptide (TPR) repeat protein|nr:tetratricopeptide repeat protein [Synergistaceae bacterium]